MDMSDITCIDENPIRREKNPQSTKHSQAKTSTTQIVYRTPAKKYIIPASQFRSLVQKLTGLPQPVTSLSASIDDDPSTVSNENPSLQQQLPKCVPLSQGVGRSGCKSLTLAEAGSMNENPSFSIEMRAYEDMKEECLRLLRMPLPFPFPFAFGGGPTASLHRIAYCTLFPKGYELEGDTLVQLWMAAGLINDEPKEDIGTAYLRALCEFEEIISFSREDYGTGKKWYKVNKFELSKECGDILRTSLLRVDNSEHVTSQTLPTKYTLKVIGRYSKIRSILLPRDHGSNINSIPYDFFMSLKFLQALDLSGSKVSELPSSIGKAKHLRYLDLSRTPIKWLPETIDSLQKLQTLKLRNCSRLVALPKGTRQMTSLRHLDLGYTTHRLSSMPLGMGALTCLRTLSNFIVGQQSGCQIRELKNMNHLGGNLCISRLENVASPDEAREANLSSKQKLTRLELRWTDDREDESIRDYLEDEVMENLRPHTNLQHLRILCYGGSRFPSWMSDPYFNKLVSITLFKCENCQLLPSLGQLPELLSLSLIELVGVKIIDFRFCRDDVSGEEDQFFAFPRLERLAIKSMVNLIRWRDVGEHDFARLTKLTIRDCPQMSVLCQLSNFCSLEYLEISCCAKLSGLAEGDLPVSVKTVVVESCPLLSSSCLVEDAKDWHKLAHSPTLTMYNREEDEGE